MDKVFIQPFPQHLETEKVHQYFELLDAPFILQPFMQHPTRTSGRIQKQLWTTRPVGLSATSTW